MPNQNQNTQSTNNSDSGKKAISKTSLTVLIVLSSVLLAVLVIKVIIPWYRFDRKVDVTVIEKVQDPITKKMLRTDTIRTQMKISKIPDNALFRIVILFRLKHL